MNKKENTKSVLSFTLLFSLGISSFPLTTAIHADTREEPSVEKTILFNGAYIIIFEYLQQDKYAEALQLTSLCFSIKFTANTLQNWWTQSGWSGIKSMGTP